MPTSVAEQTAVQSKIDNASADERQDMRDEAETTLLEINARISRGLLSREENKACDIAIEILTRLDATELGKGWLYRTKRRLQLVQMYLGG